ncbi:entericidin EcnAB [Vibrio tubiashii]|nr:entericidin EcnAB [Vibrio tubiashii]
MKNTLLIIAAALFIAGCSNTWDGVKEDSSKVWNDTKEAIHEATE